MANPPRKLFSIKGGLATSGNSAAKSADADVENIHPELRRLLGWMKAASDRAVWEVLLQRQAQFLLSDELRFFFNDSAWLQSSQVLELGFGPEVPIGSQRAFFP